MIYLVPFSFPFQFHFSNEYFTNALYKNSYVKANSYQIYI